MNLKPIQAISDGFESTSSRNYFSYLSICYVITGGNRSIHIWRFCLDFLLSNVIVCDPFPDG